MVLRNGDPGWIGSWRPGIGDPSFLGWLTVFAYVVAGVVCWRAARRVTVNGPERHRKETTGGKIGTSVGNWWYPLFMAFFAGRKQLRRISTPARLRTLWIGCAIVMLALGLNKQLDLQTALGELGRIMAHDEGWYDVRRPVQIAFIGLVLVVGIWGLRALFALAWGQAGSVSGVLWGAVFLACFVAIRASSFHHVDELLGWSLGGVRLNAVLELGGIACVLGGALHWMRRHPSAVRRLG